MKIPLIQSPIRLAVMCALALGVFSAPATAQVPAPARDYLIVTDSSGAPIFTGFGECLHAGYGSERQWTRGCDPVVYETVTFDVNVMFDSDKSALRPEGRDTLDGFIKKIEGLEAQSVLAVGYADRMGSAGSNQSLSQARVDTVKAYLVSKGITAKRVQTSAWGETRPTTFSGECKDANNAKNVNCMQADRHVFIEVSGTRIAR
jgi:outer membrane protein OmpA-like peptidoglycan-associated protein